MTAVDELREAAKVLRERATGATPEWRVDVVGPLGAETVLKHNDVVTSQWRDASHAALYTPAVGLALAELLDVLSWFPSQADPTDLLAASKLARLILAGTP